MTGQIYIRIKRKKTTIFLDCSGTDTIADLKRKVSKITKIDAGDVRLLSLPDNAVLDDAKTVDQLKIGNDDLVALVYRQAGDWEPVDITPLSEPQAPEAVSAEEPVPVSE